MKKLSKSVLDNLFKDLNELSGNASPKDILICLLNWLKLNVEIINNKPFLDYHLNRNLYLNIDDYPIEYSSLKGEEFVFFKKNIMKYTYKNPEHISRLLSEALDCLLFFEVDMACCNCQRGGLLVWKNEIEGNLIYECRQCGFLHFITDGAELSLVPATKLDLNNANLI